MAWKRRSKLSDPRPRLVDTIRHPTLNRRSMPYLMSESHSYRWLKRKEQSPNPELWNFAGSNGGVRHNPWEGSGPGSRSECNWSPSGSFGRHTLRSRSGRAPRILYSPLFFKQRAHANRLGYKSWSALGHNAGEWAQTPSTPDNPEAYFSLHDTLHPHFVLFSTRVYIHYLWNS